jgi:hypothetical protein
MSHPVYFITHLFNTADSHLLLGAAACDPAHVHRLLQSIRHGGTPPEDRGRQEVHAPRMVRQKLSEKGPRQRRYVYIFKRRHWMSSWPS